MKAFNEEDTFIAASKPINGYVKNLLDDSTLTWEQKVIYALSEVVNRLDEMRKHGCIIGARNLDRISRLESWRSWVIGGLAGFAALMGLLVFLKSFFGAS